MDRQLIISIGRQFGSGGHEIAQILASNYDIPLLDDRLLTDLACKTDISYDEIKKYDEKPRNLLFSKTVGGFTSAIEENIAKMQFEHLRKLASSGDSFVIVGRCSEYILKEYSGLVSAFITGETDTKRSRITDKYNMSPEDALKLMKKKDWMRKAYHNYYCTGKWGDSRNYDLCINSSKVGVDGAALIIEEYIRCLHK